MQSLEENRFTPPAEPSSSGLPARYCSTPIPKRSYKMPSKDEPVKKLRRHLPFSS